jgi:hypothetical protein
MNEWCTLSPEYSPLKKGFVEGSGRGYMKVIEGANVIKV